ncbi:FecR family protein [Maribacter antarcticus]|uniref:FecR family protein n=1 Tax=Maribacter antarcticus TaxID=505250 RepID=UPI00047A281D|nr:FecR domain-containing protein [Maribacter antarcticus]
MQEDYLAKWLNNELTEAELSEFKKSDAYATYQKIRATTATMQAPDFDTNQAWEELKVQRMQAESKILTLSPFKSFLKVAAVVAVVLGGAYFYLNSLNEAVATQYAETKEIILPDTSEILLNAESQVSYDEKDWNNKRNISLQGEAFFNVAKGNSFTVTTDQGTVTVLGTQFNVENRDGFFEVTCFEGLVSVLYDGKENKLTAGNAIIVVNGKLSKASAVKNGQPSWMQNESSFKSIPLNYVLAEFQRQHNITVDSKGVDTNVLFTGSFSNTDTDLALKSISVPLQIKFTLEGNNVLFYEKNAP